MSSQECPQRHLSPRCLHGCRTAYPPSRRAAQHGSRRREVVDARGHPNFAKYFGMEIRGERVFINLCGIFGWTCTPAAFQVDTHRCMKTRSPRISIPKYLDRRSCIHAGIVETSAFADTLVSSPILLCLYLHSTPLAHLSGCPFLFDAFSSSPRWEPHCSAVFSLLSSAGDLAPFSPTRPYASIQT